MNLGKQVHTLLKRNPEIFIKGLGVFKRIHTPASFDAKRNVFLPPITFIEFDAHTQEGYDFVAYLQQVHQLERLEAEQQLQQIVTGLKEQIAITGKATLDNLGDLVSYGNSYVFKPLDLTGFNFEAVETSFQHQEAAVVEEEMTVPVGEEASDTKQEGETVIQPAVETIEQPVLGEDEENEGQTPAKSRTFVYVLLALVALAILGVMYYFGQFNQILQPTEENLPVATLDSVPAIDTSFVPPVDTAVLHVQDSLVTDSVTQPKEEPKAVLKNKKYAIVIGTHPTLAKAYEEAEAFNKDGHKSVRVITPNLAKNKKRVIWDTYATKEERDSALRYVQKHIKTDAWPDILR